MKKKSFFVFTIAALYAHQVLRSYTYTFVNDTQSSVTLNVTLKMGLRTKSETVSLDPKGNATARKTITFNKPWNESCPDAIKSGKTLLTIVPKGRTPYNSDEVMLRGALITLGIAPAIRLNKIKCGNRTFTLKRDGNLDYLESDFAIE